MIAFKFLRAGRVGPFTGFVWPSDGSWVAASSSLGAPRLCSTGIHACRAEALSYWTASELWTIELGGVVTNQAQKIVAERGRLARRIDAWDAAMLGAFAKASAERAKENVLSALRGAGALDSAERLEAIPLGLALAEASEEVAARVKAIELMGGYLADAIRYGAVDPAAGAFCAAHTGLTEAGFHDERAWQSRWLVRALGLEDGS